MVIVYQKGEEFWIEIFNQTQSALADGGVASASHNLERQGIFLGLSLSLGFNPTTAVSGTGVGVAARNGATGGFLNTGDAISVLAVDKTNTSGASVTFGYHLVVFMRKIGG